MGRKDTNQTNQPSVRTKITFDMFMCGSRGGGGGGLGLLKITKLQSQHSMWAIIGHASETPFQWHFAGRPKIARLWWFLEPRSPRKNKTNKKHIRVGAPLTKLSGSAHDVSYLVFGRIHTKTHIKIFEIDFVI